MEKIRIGINGFGRIGRTLCRLIQNHPNIQVVAINDLADTQTLSHLLKYDSIHGNFNGTVDFTENYLVINGEKVNLTNQKRLKL